MHPLEQAAQLIEAHIEKLNTKSTVCPCCDLVRYEDFRQYEAHVQLSAVIKKLKRFQPLL